MKTSKNKIIPLLIPFLGTEEIEAAKKAILSSWISGNGPEGRKLEAKISKYLGVRFAVLVNNCTSALHLALMSLGIKDCEAIIPNYTFTSTGLAPILVGSKPVLCEVDFETANIDTCSIRKLITKKTKVIIPVHYAGLPCNMTEIKKIAKEYKLFVVEDAAQALGSKYKNKMIGTLGDIGCFSFHSVKNITCGEGGVLVTNNKEIYKKAIVMRDKGTNKYFYNQKHSKGFYEYISIGHNFMLSDILAAIALEQFKKLKTINLLRTKHAHYLINGLANVPNLIIPNLFNDRLSNWHLFTVRVPEGKTEKFINEMRKRGIETNTHYVPLHLNSFYKKFGYRKGNFPVSEKINNSLVRLPLYPSLTKGNLDKIIRSIKETMSIIRDSSVFN
tara:strand:+ start:496 stop:1659 length:1164 start_codon:yes stop_codon:yes gene_type:complete